MLLALIPLMGRGEFCWLAEGQSKRVRLEAEVRHIPRSDIIPAQCLRLRALIHFRYPGKCIVESISGIVAILWPLYSRLHNMHELWMWMASTSNLTTFRLTPWLEHLLLVWIPSSCVLDGIHTRHIRSMTSLAIGLRPAWNAEEVSCHVVIVGTNLPTHTTILSMEKISV